MWKWKQRGKTEFLSDEEEADQTGVNENNSSSEDEEITFSSQESGLSMNNIATKADENLFNDQEEGECLQHGGPEGNSRKNNSKEQAQVTEEFIDERINQSFGKVLNYLDQKIADLTKMMDLEKQLAENHRQLEALRAKGRGAECPQYLDNVDKASDLTIYQNAVQKKRGSSSSEDNGVDTSDELIDPEGIPINDNEDSFPE